jgi:uncharacterized protein GlcG (DUF336 family)
VCSDLRGRNIAVVDAYTHLLAFSRMDGAKITSVNIAMDKAFTAAGHRIPTSSYKEVVWSGGAAYGINHTNGGRFCTIGGGVPIIDREGNVLGAIGCSTGTPTQDEECSNAGKKAVLDLIECERVEAVAAAKRKIASIGADFKHTEVIIVEEIVA